MRRLRVVALLFGALLLLHRAPLRAQQAPAPAPPQPPQATKPQQPPTFIKKVELVDIVFSVFNRRQKFITDLQKENFSVFEDNQSQEIRFFSRETDLPLRVGMLLDTSNSIRDRLKFEQEAAIDFLYNVLRRHKDLAFLMTFDSEPSVIQDYTEDLGTLRDVILRQRAGGGAFFPYRVDDLAQSFLDIGDELRSQYSLAYVPSNKKTDGKFRNIRIEVDRKGLQVRARRGYYAPRASADATRPSTGPAAKPPGN